MKSKILLVLGFLLASLSIQPAYAWWNSEWLYKENVAMNHSVISNSLTNFTFLVMQNSTTINYSHTNSDGSDIRFVSATDDSTLEYLCIERWNTSGNSWVWVRGDSISNTTNTNVTEYYGNANTTTVSDCNKTFSGQSMVHRYALNGNGNDSVGTLNGTMIGATSKEAYIAGGYYFDGNDIISFPSAFSSATSGTVCLWFNVSSPSSYSTFIAEGQSNAQSPYFIIEVGNSGAGYFGVDSNDGSVANAVRGNTSITANTWYHACAVSNDTTWTLYLNGNLESITVQAGSNTGWWFGDVSGNSWSFGALNRSSWNVNMTGMIDEVKIYSDAKSAAWINALYQSEKNNFLTFGSEQSQSGNDSIPPTVSLITPTTGTKYNSSVAYSVSFNCSASENINLANFTLYGNWSGGWSANQTTTETGTWNFSTYSKTINPGTYIWNCYVCDNSNNCAWGTSNYTFSISDTAPAPTQNYPGDNLFRRNATSIPIAFNCSATDDINLANVSLLMNSTGTWSINQTTSLTGTWNSTEWTVAIPATTTRDIIWACQAGDNSSQYRNTGNNTIHIIAPAANGTWINGTQLPIGMADGLTIVSGNKAYMIAGYDANGSAPTNYVYEYDYQKNIYTQKANITTATMSMCGGLVGDSIYVFGGNNASTQMELEQKYNITSDTWSNITNMPYPIAGCLGIVNNNSIYIIAGHNVSGTTKSMIVYYPVNDTYAILASRANAKTYAVGGIYNGVIYSFGGSDTGANSGTYTCENYSISTGTWGTCATLPFPQFGSSLSEMELGGSIFIAMSKDGSTYYSWAWEYNATANTWTQRADGPFPRDGPMSGIWDNTLYMFSGRNNTAGTPYGLKYLSIFFPYINQSSTPQTVYCSTCQCVNDTMKNNVSDVVTVYLTANINNWVGSCIAFAGAKYKTLDCQGHSVNGDNVGNDNGISLDNNSSNNIIQNCTVSNFSADVFVNASNNETFRNITVGTFQIV